MRSIEALLEDLRRLTGQVRRTEDFFKNVNRRARRRLGMPSEKLLRGRKVRTRKAKRSVEQARRRRKKRELGYEPRRLGPR